MVESVAMKPPLLTLSPMLLVLSLRSVGGAGCAMTVIVTVAGGEAYFPSFTSKVKLSVPEKPPLGA